MVKYAIITMSVGNTDYIIKNERGMNMTYFETINEMQNSIGEETLMTRETYLEAESTIIKAISDYIIDAEVTNVKYGNGKVITLKGSTLENIILDIDFAGEIKQFSLIHIMNNKSVKFVDTTEINDIWNSAFTLHNTLTSTYKTYGQALRQQQYEAKKQAEADKKAEAKYQKLREAAIKNFDQLVAEANSTLSDVDEFYYALGWLANHVGVMTAILPDYLNNAFERYFGTETPKTLVDSRAKTSGGYAKQWSWEFRCTIKKLKETVVPACIQNITTDFSKGIHNTSFLWDLVSNYGFQFGKKQDVNKIKETIPVQFIPSFEAGLIA